MYENTYVVIMAGGSGTRFWPRSRGHRPKQLLRFFGERTMIAETIARLEGLVPPERTLIVTNEQLADAMHEAVPSIPEENILREPIGRNTAPCVGMAAKWIQARAGKDAVMAVFPADHYVRDVPHFVEVVSEAIDAARAGSIVLLGILPTRPETGYGYIRRESAGTAIARVTAFKEKPDRETAASYLADGHYVWNAGMFFMRIDTVLDEFACQLPELHGQLTDMDHAMRTGDVLALTEVFEAITPVSLDVGVMEGAKDVKVIAADFGWSDVGHWDALPEVADTDDEGNVLLGEVIAHDCRGSVLVGHEDRVLAAIGLDQIVVVDSEDAVLVAPRDRVQEVRQIVAALRHNHPHRI